MNSTVKATETVCQAFYHILHSIKTRFTQGPFFAHWCEKRPFSLSVNDAQTRVLHACVKKKSVVTLAVPRVPSIDGFDRLIIDISGNFRNWIFRFSDL